jgi:hypothetical protein
MPITSLGTFEKAAQRQEMINRINKYLREVRAGGRGPGWVWRGC